MEIEKRPEEIGKKLWKIVRIVLYMMRKSISKSKILLDLQMLLIKRGKVASKALANLLHHHHMTYTCRSHDINTSFISPREYEFSCSTTPLYKRKTHKVIEEDLKMTMNRVFDILNVADYEDSPSSTPPLVARQVRMTDLPMVDDVDRDAEEFIKKFYRDLKNQKRIAALESPSPYHLAMK